MEITEARVILANLRERIEIGGDGKYRLPGLVTQRELDALDHFISVGVEVPDTVISSPVPEPIAFVAAQPTSVEPEITLDISTLALPEADAGYRVCLDFGTAMSKATYVLNDVEMEDIQVLKLGVPGDQEQIDENMLVSSVFIDTDGLLWFGQKAVEHSQTAAEGDHARMDNIKRALSEGNLAEALDAKFNPTELRLTYEDIVLAYLAFFTWTINYALLNDKEVANVTRNFRRRFAMPCFPRANARIVEAKLKVLLGEAQLLSDTFGDSIHEGLPIDHFMAALRQLRAEKRIYPFIEGTVTEPLGVAGSLLSWRSEHDSLALVVDIGAGTSDFSLYRLHVTENEDGSFRSVAGEVNGTARGITEAGNHLDKLLKGYILRKAGISSSHPKFNNISYRLESNIRENKETLFNSHSVLVVLDVASGETVEISREEFMALDEVRAFEQSLRATLVEIMEDADPAWIEWVRTNPSRYLTIVLTGGGATLPMARRLAEGTVTAHGMTIPVAAAKPFPAWLERDYADLEEVYPRIAVSLGGARRNIIRPLERPLTTTGSGVGGHTLERFAASGI